MRILVINAGSSSVKLSVFDMPSGEQRFEHEMEKIASVEEAVAAIPALLREKNAAQVDAVGHRVAHGGMKFRDAVTLNAEVMADIKDCVPLAPLHNPPAIAGIAIAAETWPGVPQIAVFDTAFHQAMPARATTYAVPERWRDAGVRRYGFHGTSHQYMMERVAAELAMPASQFRLISCHLGNGASVCAINRGVSVDTSMGMTALEGLVMGTRSGDVDPGVFAYLNRTQALSPAEVEDALYHRSGLAALSGIGNDLRDIERRAAQKDARAELAIDVYAYRARKYIGAYAAAMGGVEALSFTAGIGENSALMRRRICEGLECLGIVLDHDANAAVKLEGFEAPQIQTADSRVKVLVTRTREQWMIARETHRLLSG
ncbi:MAG: acetate kinase [Alphaproteobacteria bacterium]|nr:acetate kinase [Alphaproteobacteria bacterium]